MLSTGTLVATRAEEAVGRCSYRRNDWVVHRPLDGLLRG
jgi:hypothetical protein